MGRELKRVPLDFSWPLGQVWEGYICPFQARQCEFCGGTGNSPYARWLKDTWYLSEDRDNAWQFHLSQADVDALVEAGRLMDFTRRPRTAEHAAQLAEQKARGESGYWLNDVVYHPTAVEVNEWARKPGHMGHDGINAYVCIQARCEREKEEDTCAVCGGTGGLWASEEDRLSAEAWENEAPHDPPNGDGYQLWETTSEGSPISPVFQTLDELCEWAESNATTFGSSRASAESWKAMLSEGFVCHCEGNLMFI